MGKLAPRPRPPAAMNSIDDSCTPIKAQYDDCFNSWFRDKFLKGKGDELGHDQACGKFFKEYQQCLKVDD